MKVLTLGLLAIMLQIPAVHAEDKQHPCDFILERIKAKDSEYTTADFQACMNRFPDYKAKHDELVKKEEADRREADRKKEEAQNERNSRIIVKINGDALRSTEFNYLKLPIVARKVTYSNMGSIKDNDIVTSADDACKYLGFEKSIKGTEEIQDINYDYKPLQKEVPTSAVIIDKEWFLGSKEQKVIKLSSRVKNKNVLFDDGQSEYFLYKSLTCERKRKIDEAVQHEIREVGSIESEVAASDSRVDNGRRTTSVDDIYVGERNYDDFFRPNFSKSK